MTLKHLRIFVTVCQCGSITEAGKKLYLAQPSVSLAISELERHYGVQLFDRISRKLYITEAGKRLLEYASHIVALVDAAENDISDAAAKGMLRVGTSITIGNFLLSDFVLSFKRDYPDISVHAVIDNSETIENMILSNELDFALIEGQSHSDAIISKPFADDELVFICPPEHEFAGKTIDARELENVDMILREPGSAGREAFDSVMAFNDMAVSPAWQSVSNQAIITAVEHGLGLSILPRMFVDEKILGGSIARFYVKNVSFARKLSIIYHKNKFISEPIRRFMELVTNLEMQDKK